MPLTVEEFVLKEHDKGESGESKDGSGGEPSDLGSRSVGEALKALARNAVRPVCWLLNQKLQDVALILGIVAPLVTIATLLLSPVQESEPTRKASRNAFVPPSGPEQRAPAKAMPAHADSGSKAQAGSSDRE